MSGSQLTGTALVGCFESTATPFHAPDIRECCLGGTGYPAVRYLKGDLVVTRPLRNEDKDRVVRCVSEMHHTSP